MNKKTGRPSKLTAEVIENIQNWLRMGYFVEDAARMAGIHKATLYRWLEQGREDRENEVDSLYADFCDAMERSRAEAEGMYLNSIKTAASRGQWQAAAWWLERSFDKWSKPSKLQISGDEEEPVKINIKYSGDK
jgi:transposase-like protein